jgi:hypothetical protein
MAQFFVSLAGGAYCLVESASAAEVAEQLNAPDANGFVPFHRPDGKTVLLDPDQVTLIQPPAPAASTKENL